MTWLRRKYAREGRGSVIVSSREYSIASTGADGDQEWLGCVDDFDGAEVRGWVFQQSTPETPLWVELLCGSQVIGRGRTGRPRPDVAAVFGVAVQPGFRIRVASSDNGGWEQGEQPLWVRVQDWNVVLAPFPLQYGERERAILRSRLRSATSMETVPSPSSWPVEDCAKPAAVAFYLPQFHPFKENDEWWGKGFTEWRNVASALPQYSSHQQPRVPSELGFYDLRLRSVLPQQGRLAREAGISAFCFYAYWFSGRTLMTDVLEQLRDGVDPVIDFCVCWANETWSRRWDGSEHQVLMEQRHDAGTDVGFIDYVMPLLKHPKYLKVDGRPVVLVYRVDILDDAPAMLDGWRLRAEAEGLPGLFVLMMETFGNTDPRPFGFDGSVQFPPHGINVQEEDPKAHDADEEFAGKLYCYDGAAASALSTLVPSRWPRFPGVMPGWDNTPRRGSKAHIFTEATTESYEAWLYQAANASDVGWAPDGQKLVFINAWNEWAEGAYLEPDIATGRSRLDATRNALSGTIRPQAIATQLEDLTKLGEYERVKWLLQAAARSIRGWDRVVAQMATIVRSLPSTDDFIAPGAPLMDGGDEGPEAPGWLEHISGRSVPLVAVGRGQSIIINGWSVAGYASETEVNRYLVFRSELTGEEYFSHLSQSEARPGLLEAGVTDSPWVADRSGFLARLATNALQPGSYSIEIVAGQDCVEQRTVFNKRLVVVE